MTGITIKRTGSKLSIEIDLLKVIFPPTPAIPVPAVKPVPAAKPGPKAAAKPAAKPETSAPATS